MVQAAVSGAVDFSAMKFFDSAWQRKLRLLLRGLHWQNERELQRARLEHYHSLLAVDKISPESLEKLQGICRDEFMELQNKYKPWAATTKQERERKQAEEQRGRWQRRFGDLDAEETQRKIEETVRALRQLRDVEPPPSEMADWFGVYSRATAGAVSGMREIKHATSRTSPPRH